TNCAAMIWLGLFFGRYNRKTTSWIKNGMADLCLEMDYQVNHDGGSFEGSISYHRLALETFLITTILAEKNGFSFPSNYKLRLEKMCEFSMHYTKQNGLAPQFGDADDGRFCILSGYGIDDMRNHRSILGIAGEFFQRNDFRKAAAENYLDGLWIFGHYEKAKDTSTSYQELVRYPDTGFYIIRNNEVFLMLKCGGIGQKNNGGHDHNDQLSFELHIGGVDLIIDPGSYVYTMDKDLRHLFRSTKFHNVSQIGRFEQNIIINETVKDIFTMYSSNPGICTFFDKTSAISMRFLGEIAIAGTEIQYIRSVELMYSDKRIDIMDTFSGTREEGTCRLHLARDVQVKHLADKTVIIHCDHACARIEAEMPINVDHGMISPSYGIKYDSLILSWKFRAQTKFRIYY
ncbi:MAG: alginate lyase family protein, partial [Desulfatirhabdiaceae bacterium]